MPVPYVTRPDAAKAGLAQYPTEPVATPVPFWDAVGAGWEASKRVTQLGARDSAQADALADRDAQIRARLGYGFRPESAPAAALAHDPESRLGGGMGADPTGTPPFVWDPQYEAWVDQQRELHPDQMRDIPTSDQVHAQVARQIGDIASRGAQAYAGNPLGAAIGGVAGSITDPINALASLIPVAGEANVGRTILMGGARQAALWSAVTAAQAPLKAAEAARSGGPAYGTKEAISDVEQAAGGAFVLHGATSLLGAGARRLFGASPEAGAVPPPNPDAAAPPPPGPDAPGGPAGPAPPPSSPYPAEMGSDGRYPVDASGHVVSDAGGPIRFDQQSDAARWILREGHRTSLDQRFEVSNHPDGSGFTAREFVRAGQPPAAGAPVPEVEPEAVSAAVDKLNLGALDDAAVSQTSAPADHEAGLAGMSRGDPVPPTVEPVRDITTIEADPARPPQVDSSPGVQILSTTTQQGRDVHVASFDPRALSAAPELFQYKSEGDAEGVTARLRGVQTWDPMSSGQTIVWESPEGEHLIADGHQRRGLAVRLLDQGPTLNGYLLRAADGWSAPEVRSLAALKNIREGSGTPLDAAKVLRQGPALARDGSLPLSGEFMHRATGLAKLSDDAFGAAVNGVVKQSHASLIGNMAGDRPDLHGGMVNLLARAKPANMDEAQALIGESLDADWLKNEGDTGDLFGDVAPESTMIARAKIKASVLASLRQNAKVFGTLTRNADAIEAGGNALARTANESALAANRAAEALISKLAMRSGDVGDAMAAAARDVSEGKPVSQAARQVLDRVLDHIRDAEAADAERKIALDPDPPTPADVAHADLFGEPAGKGVEAQLAAKPEDAAEEAGVLADRSPMGQAADVLKPCAPE